MNDCSFALLMEVSLTEDKSQSKGGRNEEQALLPLRVLMARILVQLNTPLDHLPCDQPMHLADALFGCSIRGKNPDTLIFRPTIDTSAADLNC